MTEFPHQRARDSIETLDWLVGRPHFSQGLGDSRGVGDSSFPSDLFARLNGAPHGMSGAIATQPTVTVIDSRPGVGVSIRLF